MEGILDCSPTLKKFFPLFTVQHLFSLSIDGTEGEYGVSEEGGEDREEPKEETIHGRHQQVSIFRLRRHDGVEHGVDDQVGILEAHLARWHKVLVGQLDVLTVEYFLFLIVQFLPNIKTALHPHDVGGLAKVTRLDDADLREGESQSYRWKFCFRTGSFQGLNQFPHLHSKAGHFNPEAVCERLQASLRHAVGSHIQAGEEGEDAGGVDHPTFGGTDQRQKCDGGPDAAEQVDVHHVLEIFDRAPLDLGPVGDSSVVYDGPQAWQGGEKSHHELSFCETSSNK